MINDFRCRIPKLSCFLLKTELLCYLINCTVGYSAVRNCVYSMRMSLQVKEKSFQVEGNNVNGI